MIDGTYDVEAKTPLGTKGGTLVLTSEGDVCDAALTVAGKTAHLKGSLDGDNVTFTGSVSLPFPLGKQDYTLVGSVDGDRLSGVCSTRKFKFDVMGVRVA